MADKLEPGSTAGISIEVGSTGIIKASSNKSQVQSIISFDDINFDDINDEQKTQIKTQTKNIIHNAIESSSATVALSAEKVTITVSTNKGVYGIDAVKTALDELSNSITSEIKSIITQQTGTDPGESTFENNINTDTNTLLSSVGNIISTDQLIYNKYLGVITLGDYSNTINVSDYIEITGLNYEIVTGHEYIVSAENEQFIIINKGNNSNHNIEINGSNVAINTKIIFSFIIKESDETAINLSGVSNFTHYPLMVQKTYEVTDFYDYYRKDYINYYLCNLTTTTNIYINENKQLIITPEDKTSLYHFIIKAEDPLKSLINQDITFTVKNVANVTDNIINSQSVAAININITDQIKTEDFLNYYILDKADSNILNVSTSIEEEQVAFSELIESNVSISDTNMVLTIKPTNVKLNYNIRLSVAYKDLITGNGITEPNTSIIYNVVETGVFSFYDSSLNTITYPLINLTNNEITCNLIENINLHYTTSLNINDIKFSNINPPILDLAHYKNNIYSNAYILDADNKTITFSGEYRDSNYSIKIQAYFEEYSNVKLTQIYQIQEAEIEQISLKNEEQTQYTYLNQSNQVIYLSNILSLYDYVYSNELQITYTSNKQTDANPYYFSLINDTLRIDTDYRGDSYVIYITVRDSNFNRINNEISISITEIEPFVLKDVATNTITFSDLKNDRLLISLNEYYDINIPVNKTNNIYINNTFLTDIDIEGEHESNIENDIITLTFDYRTILKVTNETDDKISLTETNDKNIIITAIDRAFNSSYFMAQNNNVNIISYNNPIPSEIRSPYQYNLNEYFIWDTKNVKLNTEYYIINYSKYNQNNNKYFIIKFTDKNDENYNKIIKTLYYNTSIRDVFGESTINSNVIVHQTIYDNSFNYNANYRNSNIDVAIILSNIDYPNQTKTINLEFIEDSRGDIVYNDIEVKLISSNTNILQYNLYEVYCNNAEFDRITYSVHNIKDKDDNDLNIENYNIIFENCNILIQPNFRGNTYDITIKAEDTSFDIDNTDFSINIEEYPPLKFNEGFNSNIVINNLSNNTIIRNIFNDITVYATHCNLIFSNSYLSNCSDTEFGYYNSLKLFSNPVDSPTTPYDNVDSNIYNISFNPEYRNKTYTIGYNIYMSGYESQYIEVKFILTEINIPIIDKLESIQTTISETYESNIPDIINLSDLYNYPYSNELKFNITSTSNYTYDNNNILTFTPDFRNENYVLNIEAYDPYFTNQTLQNSLNNDINFNITEKPPLEFNSLPAAVTFTYNVSNNGFTSYEFAESYDRNGLITGTNPYITIYINDTIKFIRTTSGHSINIRNSSGTLLKTSTDNKTTYSFTTSGEFEYYCSVGHSSMKGTINVIEIPLQNQRYIEYNLGRTEKHFDIIDNVRIYATHCNIIINNITTLNTDDVRPAYYNTTYPNAITIINDSNLTIATEHRGITYENTFDIYMSGYDTQKISKTFNISELSIQPIINNNNVYTSTIKETKTFILKDLYNYPYVDELVFSIIDAKQKLKTVNSFENNIDSAIIHGLSNINYQCNLFIDLEIDEQEFKFTIKAEDTKFKLENVSLTIEITKDTPLNFNVPNFTNQLMVTENITNMSNSIITIDFFDKYVLNIDEGNILVIEPMYGHNPHINGRLAYYPDYYPIDNEGKPYNIIDSNVYFLPEHRGTEYSNIFKLYARNVEYKIDYDSYYLQVNCICSEIQVPNIEFNNNKATIFTSLPIQFNSIAEESYDLSTLYTYPYLNYLIFDYTVDQYIPYSNTVMEQSNLNIILKPKLRGKNYTITINAYDSNFQISNSNLYLNINEIPAIRFIDEEYYTDSYVNTKTITISDLTNTQIICNLESYIYKNAETTILFSNIFPLTTEVREAHYDTTTNNNALKRTDTTITEANIVNITTDTIESYNGKDSYKVNTDIIENINLINGKEFSVAFNFYFTTSSTETEYFSIDGFNSDEDRETVLTVLKCKIDTNKIKFETNSLTIIEHSIDSTPGWKYIVFNLKENKRELYINNLSVLTVNNEFNNDLASTNITINSNIGYFQSFRIIDKPLTINDINYLFNNQINTLFYEKNNLYINPEYRNQTYTAQVVLTTEGYEEISRTLEFIITETQIQPIQLKFEYDILNYTYCNLLNHTCNIANIKDLYNYPFSNHLIFTTSTNKNTVSYDNKEHSISYNITIDNDLTITADYRDIDYIVTLTATDDKFGLENDIFKVFIHEKPPIEFNNFELINIEYLTNLEKTELTCNIYDNIIINVDSKYLSNLSYYNNTVSRNDIRKAFYNKTDDNIEGKDAYYLNGSNLEIIPEYRNQNYILNFNINIEGYETQTITKIYDITECNIPPIVIDQTVNINFVDLSNEPFINNDLADYFTTYPFKDALEFIIIEPEDIADRKSFTVETFNIHSIQDRQFKVIPDFRDATYSIKLLVYDPNFSYLYSPNYDSTSSNYTIPEFKPKNTRSIIEDLNDKDINNYSSNNVNESLELYFTEIPPIEFNNIIDIIYYCNLTKDTETYNIYPNIKFNTPTNNIITTSNYISSIPETAVYKPLDELNAISITDISNINIHPEYRNTSYIININIAHSDYLEQAITQTFFIHECNIPNIEFKYPHITFEYLNQETTAINLECNNDLKEYFNYPFANQLEYSFNISNMTQNIPVDLISDPNISIENSNITIQPDFKGYMYSVEITAIDTNFGLSNSDFVIIIEEKPPIELVNTLNIYSNLIVIDNLSNVNYIIDASNIYKRNYNTDSALVIKDINRDSTDISSFKRRDSKDLILNFGSSLRIFPYYRDVNYNYVYDISIKNNDATEHKYSYFKLKLVLNITELPIKPIRLYESVKVTYPDLTYPDLSNNVIPITDLRSLYDYPFSNHLQFKYSNSETGNYNIIVTDDDLTVIAALRDQTYTVTLQAFDPSFTYSSDSSYSEYYLSNNTTNSNLVNEELQFEFQELPAIRFQNTYELSKTINITTTGDTQSNIDLMDYVKIYTDHSNFMLSNSSGLPTSANYILGDYSNAVFFGHPIDGTVSTYYTIININPEYRGIEYTVNIDIYMSNYKNTAITLSLVINEETIKPIRLYNSDKVTYPDLTYPDLSNNVIPITDLRSLYDYPFSNHLQFKYSNSETGNYNIIVTDDDLTVIAALRDQTYTVTLQAFDPSFTYSSDSSYSEYYLSNNTTNSNLVNEELQFEFQELPAIRFKDSYNGCNYYEFDILEYSGNSYTFTQNYLTNHIFVKGLEECNIILNVKESSTFKSYVLDDTSNELTIEFDFNYYELCNIDFKAYLENYPDNPLDTTIRVIIPVANPIILTNDKQYYNLIGDEYLNPITHKIEFPNIFKNPEGFEDTAINIINIQGENASSFNYDENMIYSYIKPSTTFYKPNNDITPSDLTLLDSIQFSSFNNNYNEVGPYYQMDGNKYNVIYAFKHNDTGYTIKFEEKFNNCNLEVLVVGGGGGGTSGTTIQGNGGSGGKVIYNNIMIDSNKTYNIVVGDGGDSDTAGGNSYFDNIIAIGGGVNENPTIHYVNNSWIETKLDFKVEGVGYSNVEEIIFSNLGCNLSSFMLPTGAGSTTEDPLLGKYEENSSNFYDIYNNASIGDYSNSKIYFGGGGNFGYGLTQYTTTVLSRSAYSCGFDVFGQLGHENVQAQYNDPILIDALADSNIVAINAGNFHSLFLNKYGRVYSCGYNDFSELGRTEDRTIPLQITENIGTSNIVAISAGEHYSLFLDEYGRVYSCGGGWDYNGKLGRIVVDNNSTIPVQITENIGDSNIIAISAGSEHSLFLDDKGRVYSCGDNPYGQLGHGNKTNCNLPTLIDALADSNIVAISTGKYHSLFLNKYGRVYSCGYSGYGVLGRTNTSDPNDIIPLQITENIGTSNIVAISAGKYHSLFLNDKGRVYSCGYNNEGQLGHGNKTNCNLPTLIDALADSNIVAISTGVDHSLFLDEYGRVYSCGRNDYTQLGRTGDKSIPLQITNNIDTSNIVAISGGYYGSLFISADAITEIKTQLPSLSLGGGGDSVADSSSQGKELSGGGGSGGAINNSGGKGGSGIVLLKHSSGNYYPDEYYCNSPPFYQELTVTASNILGEHTATLRFLKLGYTTLTVPDLTSDKVSNIYLFNEEVTHNVGRTFSIEYNPIDSGCNLEIDNSNLIIKDDKRGTYDTIIKLDYNIYDIFRIHEKEDDTVANTYAL